MSMSKERLHISPAGLVTGIYSDEHVEQQKDPKHDQSPFKPIKEPKGDYKFNELEYVQELQRVIDSTYTGHYSRQHFQATEFIIDGGHGTGFCIGNIMKYAQRYGKKGTNDDARKDILKVLHYAIIQLYVHDSEEFDKCADIDTKMSYNAEKEYKYDTD